MANHLQNLSRTTARGPHVLGRNRENLKHVSSSSSDGSVYTKQKQTSKKIKMLTAVLKFIVDSIEMFASRNQRSSRKRSQRNLLRVKSTFSYATKLLNLVLNAATEASPAPVESFNLASDLLDLIISSELFLGPAYAARFVAAAKPWLPDLMPSLRSTSMLEQSQERPYLTALDHIKLHFPSWPLILAKIELAEMSESDPEEEDDRVSEPEFPEFKKLMGMIISLLRGNRSILDAVGVIFLASLVVGLERKDFGLLLGLLGFVCLKLIGQEDREWSELDMMLVSLSDIYPHIEIEIEEQGDEDENHKLNNARALLEPVWLYHVHETERFSEMEE
ncbi:hypothetical protein CRYUN_Cryun17cG0112400 [Craigia yunnanensis]